MPSTRGLLVSIRRWLRVTALLLGLAVFEIASVAEGVNSYTTAAPASKLLAAVVVCVAASGLLFGATGLADLAIPAKAPADGGDDE